VSSRDDGAPSDELEIISPPPERAEIAADIDRARARVAASLTTLGEKVARRRDWRSWVRERPTLVVAGALALGFLVGADAPSRED
jgi:hypothetical protein